MRHESDWWLGGFLAGFIIGFVLGFWYTRLVPVRVHPSPAELSQEDKEIYLVLIGAAFRYDGDLEKTTRRLTRLEEPAMIEAIRTLADQKITAGADVRDIRSLAALATGLGLEDGQLLVYLTTPTPSPTSTSPPPPTPTQELAESSLPEPDANATFTPRNAIAPDEGEAFELAQSIALCDNSSDGVLRVYVRDSTGQGIAGVEILARWPGGQDKFFTGIKSEANPGYADFQMDVDQTYQLELPGMPATIATEVNRAAKTLCPNLPLNIAPSWQIVFQQSSSE